MAIDVLRMNKYYKILELPYDAPWTDVKQAYRDLVRVWHPDRFARDVRLQQRATRKLTEINEAYTFLKKLSGNEPEAGEPGISPDIKPDSNIEFEPIDWSQCTKEDIVVEQQSSITKKPIGIRFLRWRWYYAVAGIPLLALLMLVAFASTSQGKFSQLKSNLSGERSTPREKKRGTNIEIPDEAVLPLVGSAGRR